MPSPRKYIGPFSSMPVGSDANVSVVRATAAIGATGLLGASAPTGLYRVSAFCTINVAGGGGSLQLILKAQQEGGPVALSTFALPPLLIASSDIESASFIISSDGTADITYEVDFLGATIGSLQYSLRIVMEQLSL